MASQKICCYATSLDKLLLGEHDRTKILIKEATFSSTHYFRIDF